MAAQSNTGHTIDKVETTSETLSGRGGLSLFALYLSRIQIYLFLERLFGAIRKNAKGQPEAEMFKQVFCFLVEGFSRHLVFCETLKSSALSGDRFLYHLHGYRLFCQKLLQAFHALGLGVICSGRIFDDIQKFAERTPNGQWRRYQNRQQAWDFLEYGDRRGSWDTFWRAILCRPVATGPQRLLAFARPLSIYYTNLGMGGVIDQQLAAVGREQACQAEQIIAMAHGRGADELVHRGRKDFGFEALPFLRFRPNAALY